MVAQRLEGVHVGHVAPQAHLLGGLGQLGGGVGVGLGQGRGPDDEALAVVGGGGVEDVGQGQA